MSAQDNPGLGCEPERRIVSIPTPERAGKRSTDQKKLLTNELLGMATGSALLLRLDELLGLGEEDTDDANGERSTGTDPEEDFVGIGGGTLRGESESEGGSEEVAE